VNIRGAFFAKFYSVAPMQAQSFAAAAAWLFLSKVLSNTLDEPRKTLKSFIKMAAHTRYGAIVTAPLK